MIGLLVLVYFQANRSSNNRIKDIPEALESENLSLRIAALKSIQQKKLDITAYRSYRQLLNSPHPQERYWLVVALAVSRSQKSFIELLKLLEDKNTNVRCMAFHSLGLQNNRQAIKPILAKIKISHDWYAQLYAYKALRSLGWKQKKLP
jgi:HEAT repeat protein